MGFTETQNWSAKRYAEHGRFVADLAGDVVALLNLQPGERVLDLGCGDGVLTAELAKVADVIGVDASADMIAAAKILGLDARVMSGEALTFNSEFDAVFSNAALHWMPNVDAVIIGVWDALKPGGRFVAECGGFANIAAIRTAVRAAHKIVTGRAMGDDAKLFPSPNWYKTRLEAAGFSVSEIAIHNRQTPLKSGITAWYETFGGRFFKDLNQDETNRVIEEAEALLRPELVDEFGTWFADYQRLRFHAVKPLSVQNSSTPLKES